MINYQYFPIVLKIKVASKFKKTEKNLKTFGNFEQAT